MSRPSSIPIPPSAPSRWSPWLLLTVPLRAAYLTWRLVWVALVVAGVAMMVMMATGAEMADPAAPVPITTMP